MSMLKQKGVILSAADVVLTPSQKLIKEIANKYGLTYRDLVYNRSRDARTTIARHEAIQTLKATFPTMTNSKIGRMFSGMDPSSITYVLRKNNATQGWAAKLPGLLLEKKSRRPVAYSGSVTA